MPALPRRLVSAVARAALGLVAAAAPVHASGAAALDGSWAVAEATMNGKPRPDGKVLNGTWTFRGTELVVRNPNGESLRAALSFDATAEPPAFHVTPIEPPGERALWMIWARHGDELRLAFYDGTTGRPEDFGPRRKLVVLTLVPAPAAVAPVADPCAVMRGAGVDHLLGGPSRPRRAGRPSGPGMSCALDRTDGSRAISLTLIAAPAGRAYADAVRQEVETERRVQLDEEPALGAGAFSVVRGWTAVVVAVRRGTAMILTLDARAAELAELRRFAVRVLDAL